MRAQGISMLLLILASPGMAQRPAEDLAGDPALFPPLVEVAKLSDGYRYVDVRGMTLYMLDPRDARGRIGTVLDYCVAECAERFTPLAADPKDPPVGLWKPQQTRRGWAWTYRESPVFTYRGDTRPGDSGGDGYDTIVRTIEWVPPQPRATAPAPATPLYVSGRWLLSDDKGRALFTSSCAARCQAEPFRAGLAARAKGEWSIVTGADGPQWAWRRRPVFVAAASGTPPVEAGAEVIEASAK